jgi:uncharacterized membrane protein
VLWRPLALVSAVLTGVLTGGMVFIEVVLLPFWRGLSPAEFRAWFAAHSDRIRALMVPLGAATGIACTASASARVAGGRRGAPAAVAAAGAAASVIAVTVTVNEPANHRFAAGTLTDGETTTLLRRWARWHHLRVALGLAASVAAARALVGAEDRVDYGIPARRGRVVFGRRLPRGRRSRGRSAGLQHPSSQEPRQRGWPWTPIPGPARTTSTATTPRR